MKFNDAVITSVDPKNYSAEMAFDQGKRGSNLVPMQLIKCHLSELRVGDKGTAEYIAGSHYSLWYFTKDKP